MQLQLKQINYQPKLAKRNKEAESWSFFFLTKGKLISIYTNHLEGKRVFASLKKGRPKLFHTIQFNIQ